MSGTNAVTLEMGDGKVTLRCWFCFRRNRLDPLCRAVNMVCVVCGRHGGFLGKACLERQVSNVALLLELELGLKPLARLSPAWQLGVTSSLLMPLPTAGRDQERRRRMTGRGGSESFCRWGEMMGS